MTQEEKAKLYDEAVINGSRLWECDKITREDYEFIFPALEEGEDERIIGNIIATIHLYYGEPLEDEAKEMLSWLERRGQTFTKKDVDDAYLKGVCDAKHEIEKQGKNNMGISESTKQKLEDNLNKALEKETPESWNKFLDEQNSSWSEEDEKSVNIILDICSDFKKVYSYSKTVLKDANKIESFLKSLKNRVQPQPKQEWSEKDEGILQTVINRLELLKNRNASEIPYVERCVEWLKSLKERYAWKPSEEQVDALVSAIDIMIDNRGAGDKKTILLSGLYHELKAL